MENLQRELRIGNYLMFGKQLKKVVEITEDAFYVLDKDGTTLKNTWADLKPTPLTEEWLLKFGFKYKNGYGFIFKYGYISKQDKYWIYHNICKKIDFVHQLQNLYFALTGEELIINN